QHTPIHYAYRNQLDSSASTPVRPPNQGSLHAKSDDFDQVMTGGLNVHSLVESPFGDNENLPAAVARCLGLAYVRLDEMFRHRALEFCQTGTLEQFDDEVAAGLQRSGSKFECQLSQMNAPRLIDAVDTRQVGGHVR